MAESSISLTVHVPFQFCDSGERVGRNSGRSEVEGARCEDEQGGSDLGKYSVEKDNRVQRRRQGSNGGGDLKFSLSSVLCRQPFLSSVN